MNQQAGWRLRIEHLTRVRYAGPVRRSFSEARMTPLTLPSQAMLDSRVTVGPGTIPVPLWSGNQVAAVPYLDAVAPSNLQPLPTQLQQVLVVMSSPAIARMRL